ncbi:hypothetical protein NHF48_014670 [Sphingomonas sp. H160509]|uniref:hypothetical protein n=1 Tax=Sphingomonas sp. H160509 TaxID=2955313 RepID=UPI0020968DF7|nr:hypothetical protein [Sphingomonas sp. H160509]MDD1451908.1 hypothetical protein [Sphingomonas sp. H160509]
MARIFLKIALLATSFTATAVVAQRPANYPRSYDQLISDARVERQVRIYGNADRAELLPVVAAFRKRYPGITVLYADIGSTEMYRRFVTETRAKKCPPISSGRRRWTFR